MNQAIRIVKAKWETYSHYVTETVTDRKQVDRILVVLSSLLRELRDARDKEVS